MGSSKKKIFVAVASTVLLPLAKVAVETLIEKWQQRKKADDACADEGEKIAAEVEPEPSVY